MERTSRPARQTSDSPDSERSKRPFGLSLSRRSVLRAIGVGTLGATVGASAPVIASHHTTIADDSCLLPTEVMKLTPSDGERDDFFGLSVSASADGTTVLVGSRNGRVYEEAGSAYVYDLTQTPPAETILEGSDVVSDDFYGESVALSADGTTAIVGSLGDDDAGDFSGAAYVYDLTQNPPSETKLTASDATGGEAFGNSVSINADGTRAAVGAFVDDDEGDNSGSAYVYDLTQSPPAETKLTASDAAAGFNFGRDVSISADGNTVLVGAVDDDHAGPTAGSAYVYDLTQSPPTETKLTASDAEAYDAFGISVSISADATTALVGAYGSLSGDELGAAYVYDLTQSPPTETKLTSSDLAPVDAYGLSVSIDADGTTAVVGAYGNDDAGNSSGSAYIYDLTQNPPSETKLTASDAAFEDEFGLSVASSADGTTVLVGAPWDDDVTFDAGSVYVYDLPVFSQPIELPNGKVVTPVDRDGDGRYEDLAATAMSTDRTSRDCPFSRMRIGGVWSS